MSPKTKVVLALVMLFIGMFLVLEGSKITTSVNPVYVDLALIVVGAVLVLVYMPLVGDYLEVTLKAPRMINLMPMLLALGAALVFQGATRVGVGIVAQLLFVILGIVLVVGSALMIMKAKAKKSQPAIVVAKPKKSRPAIVKAKPKKSRR